MLCSAIFRNDDWDCKKYEVGKEEKRPKIPRRFAVVVNGNEVVQAFWLPLHGLCL
jgi:hypothetical protein